MRKPVPRTVSDANTATIERFGAPKRSAWLPAALGLMG
jgi:hypothetical protein